MQVSVVSFLFLLIFCVFLQNKVKVICSVPVLIYSYHIGCRATIVYINSVASALSFASHQTNLCSKIQRTTVSGNGMLWLWRCTGSPGLPWSIGHGPGRRHSKLYFDSADAPSACTTDVQPIRLSWHSVRPAFSGCNPVWDEPTISFAFKMVARRWEWVAYHKVLQIQEFRLTLQQIVAHEE